MFGNADGVALEPSPRTGLRKGPTDRAIRSVSPRIDGPASMRARTPLAGSPGGKDHIAHVAPSASQPGRSKPGTTGTATSKPSRCPAPQRRAGSLCEDHRDRFLWRRPRRSEQRVAPAEPHCPARRTTSGSADVEAASGEVRRRRLDSDCCRMWRSRRSTNLPVVALPHRAHRHERSDRSPRRTWIARRRCRPRDRDRRSGDRPKDGRA